MKLPFLLADGVIASESHKSGINISSMAGGTQASSVCVCVYAALSSRSVSGVHGKGITKDYQGNQVYCWG